MNHPNPTPLRLGATGFLDGQSYRVVGRVVVGMEEAGETYYWQEFNLVDRTGLNATLVWEDGEWKLFTLFEPRHPLTAPEAAGKRLGETVNLDGQPTPITLVDESRVYFIEGVAPEGIEVGDIAHYFNADAGDRMIVASWTGDEIEFYWGTDLNARDVASAFGFTAPATLGGGGALGVSPANVAGKVVPVLILGVIALVGFNWWRHRPPPIPRKPPTPAGLTNSNPAVAHSVVEWARAGGIADQHEYVLPDGLLVGGGDRWHWYQPVTNPPELTPPQAAAKRIGDLIPLAGREWTIRDLFLRKAAGASFGFLAGNGAETALVRWTEDAIVLHIGRPVSVAEARALVAR